MEWYTIVVTLGLFSLWCATNAILSLCAWIISFADIPTMFNGTSLKNILTALHIPSGFANMLCLLPNVVVAIVYYMFKLPEWTGGRCHWFWDYQRRVHFNMHEFDPPCKTKDVIYLYATFPHGLYATTTMVHFVVNEVHLDVVTAATSVMFWIPGLRELACLGGVIPANSHDIVEQLDAGKHVALVPEGLRGLFHNDNEGTLALLDTRKGFIRCALGSSNVDRIAIVPVHMDGERNLNRIWLPWPWLQKKLLSRFYYPWPVFSWGLWWLGFWPRSTSVNVRYGNPIPVDGKTVDQVHAEFMNQVERLLEPLEQAVDLSEQET